MIVVIRSKWNISRGILGGARLPNDLMILTKVPGCLGPKWFGYTNQLAEPRSTVWTRCSLRRQSTIVSRKSLD